MSTTSTPAAKKKAKGAGAGKAGNSGNNKDKEEGAVKKKKELKGAALVLLMMKCILQGEQRPQRKQQREGRSSQIEDIVWSLANEHKEEIGKQKQNQQEMYDKLDPQIEEKCETMKRERLKGMTHS